MGLKRASQFGRSAEGAHCCLCALVVEGERTKEFPQAARDLVEQGQVREKDGLILVTAMKDIL